MKRIKVWMLTIFLVIASVIPVYAQGEPEESQLFARSACLMDADSGRVLYDKNGQQKMANASTTKIMTCIVALEEGNLDDVVTVSDVAAKQPKVHLGMKKGDQFTLGDLLYSLMLESHNDSAVAIAEHIGGSVADFAKKMNQKAAEIGCNDTYFITPNGLDGQDEFGKHSTTAQDLSRIMKYCIKESPQKDAFLEITRTPSYSFWNKAETISYNCNNHNAFLGMMEGALSGKTGFTGDAGYCYVGALERDGKTFIVSLLACGWPNNKTYKWSDTAKLMNYGLEQYQYQDVLDKEFSCDLIPVNDGQYSGKLGKDSASMQLEMRLKEEDQLNILLREDEQVTVEYDLPDQLEAPVKEGAKVGKARYMLGGEVIKEYPIYTCKSVKKINFGWCLEIIKSKFLIKR